MKIEPIGRSSLVDTVVERIRSLIEDGPMSAGERLPSEAELVERLQVSRPVLREAVSRLEMMGLLTVRRGLGMFVGDRGSLSSCAQLLRSAMAIAPRELARFAEFRRAIECYAARRAAEVASEAELAELESICEEMDRPDQDHLEAVRLDGEFHRKLVDITHNELMQNVMQVIHEFVIASMVQTTPRPRNRARSQRLHGAILDAVRAGDPDAAEQAMRIHMSSVDTMLHALDEKRQHRTPAVVCPT